MITGFIISAFYSFVGFMISLLPNSSGLPSGVTSAISNTIIYAHAWDWLFPISTLFTAAGIAIVFEISIFGFKTLNWIVGKLRGSN